MSFLGMFLINAAVSVEAGWKVLMLFLKNVPNVFIGVAGHHSSVVHNMDLELM